MEYTLKDEVKTTLELKWVIFFALIVQLVYIAYTNPKTMYYSLSGEDCISPEMD